MPNLNSHKTEGGLHLDEKVLKRSQHGRPLVSIITIVFNGEKTLEQTIQSVLNQTYGNIEYIIIDGGSTDGTLDIIRRYDDKIAYWISEPDRGISDAFNKGIDLASGEIITFLNSDDYYANENVVERVVEKFKNDSIMIVYGRTLMVSRDTVDPVVVKGWEFSHTRMKRYMIMPHQSIFSRRQVHDAIGKFKCEYVIASDYDYFFRASKVYTPHFINEILAVMRLGGKSDSEVFNTLKEYYRVQRKNGVPFSEALLILVINNLKTALRILVGKIGLNMLVKGYRKITGQHINQP